MSELDTVLETMKSSILHIIVVGFHHKKGCQVGEIYESTKPFFFIDYKKLFVNTISKQS